MALSVVASNVGRKFSFGAIALLPVIVAGCSLSIDGRIEPGASSDRDAPLYVATVPAPEAAARADLTGARLVAGNQADGLGTASAAGTAPVAFLALDDMPLGTASISETGQAPVVFEVNGVVFELNADRFVASGQLEALTDSTVWADSWSDSNRSVRADGDSTVWADGDSTVWADGDSTVWADGDSTVWADGDSTVWADGDSTVWADSSGYYYSWMPPNSGLWHRVNLRGAHGEADNLGHEVVVAVLDTGVDMTHPLLAGALSAAGWNFVENNDDPDETGTASGSYGHGTIVAGIVRQIAPRATILPVRVLESDGSGDVLDVVQGVYYAVQQGADVINLSLGSREESPALTAALNYAMQNGVFVTSTAGNANLSGLNYPAALAHTDHRMFSVTSVDLDDAKSVFSNFDYTADIAAPGEFVYGPYPGGGLAAWSGTSMAAPVVAGAIALALGEDELNRNSNNWSSRFSRRLTRSTADIYHGGLNADYRHQLGAGRLDAEAFLDRVLR